MADVVYPHEFQDGPGNTASGEAVMDNLNAITAQVNGNLGATNMAADTVENRMHGPYAPTFTNVAPGATATADVTHNLETTAITPMGAPTAQATVEWGYSTISANVIRISARNPTAGAATFSIRFYLLED